MLSKGKRRPGRPKTTNINLPDYVRRVLSKGKTYYYWQPRRGRPDAPKAVLLGSDINDPRLWKRLNELITLPSEGRSDTFSSLITAYKASPEWGDGKNGLRPKTKENYCYIFRKLIPVIGTMPVANLTRRHVFEMRDALSDRIDTANMMLKVLRALLIWAIARDYRDDNPAAAVPNLKKDASGHKPWPQDAYVFVMQTAPEMLRRLIFLGRATGQRLTDLIEIRPSRIEGDGIRTRISKLRDKRHFVPLFASQMIELQRWIAADGDGDRPFLRNTEGNKCTVRYLDRAWQEWREAQSSLSGIDLSIHGLKVTAVCDRVGQMETKEIAVVIGMSERMVEHYTRYIDQEAKARAARDKHEANVTGNVIPITRRKAI